MVPTPLEFIMALTVMSRLGARILFNLATSSTGRARVNVFAHVNDIGRGRFARLPYRLLVGQALPATQGPFQGYILRALIMPNCSKNGGPEQQGL
jgi:hypothetical protein